MQSMSFYPLHDRVIVRPADDAGKTKGGLYIPDIAKRSKLIGRGEVIAVGGGRIALDGTVGRLFVRVGDLAIYALQQASPIPWGPDEEECHVLREPDILGVYRVDESTRALAETLADREVMPELERAMAERFEAGPHPALPTEES